MSHDGDRLRPENDELPREHSLAAWGPLHALHAWVYRHFWPGFLHLPWLKRRHSSDDFWNWVWLGLYVVVCAGGWDGQVQGSGNQPNTGRCGFRGQYASVWSSCRQYWHLGMAWARPVKASLKNVELVEDQLRSFRARAVLRNCLS